MTGGSAGSAATSAAIVADASGSGGGAAEGGEIRTIFWDIGGVLLTNGWDVNQRREVLTRIGADLAAYEALHDEVNWFWERGLMGAEEFFQKTLFATSPDLRLGWAEFWPLVCAESRVLYPESFAVLDALRAGGAYRLATLNNESRELNGYRLDTFGLRARFDYLVCSAYVHEMKPAPRIFEDAVAISGLPAATALLIDDKAENCAAARDAGMKAVQFREPAQLRDDLRGHGIQIAYS